MKREYPEHPIVGVSAVIFVDKSVLLVRRKQEPARGQWSLPGGAVELGESILEALARELKEELSVKIAVGGLVGVFDKIFHDHQSQVQYHYVIVDYWGWLLDGNPTPASDVSEALLVPLGELEEFDTDKEVKETVRKAYGAWQQSSDSVCT